MGGRAGGGRGWVGGWGVRGARGATRAPNRARVAPGAKRPAPGRATGVWPALPRARRAHTARTPPPSSRTHQLHRVQRRAQPHAVVVAARQAAEEVARGCRRLRGRASSERRAPPRGAARGDGGRGLQRERRHGGEGALQPQRVLQLQRRRRRGRGGAARGGGERRSSPGHRGLRQSDRCGSRRERGAASGELVCSQLFAIIMMAQWSRTPSPRRFLSLGDAPSLQGGGGGQPNSRLSYHHDGIIHWHGSPQRPAPPLRACAVGTAGRCAARLCRAHRRASARIAVSAGARCALAS